MIFHRSLYPSRGSLFSLPVWCDSFQGISRKRNELLPFVHCPSIWIHTRQNANTVKRIFTYKNSQNYSSPHVHSALHNIETSLRKCNSLIHLHSLSPLPASLISFYVPERALIWAEGCPGSNSLQHYTTLLHIILECSHPHPLNVVVHARDFLSPTLIPQNFPSCAFIILEMLSLNGENNKPISSSKSLSVWYEHSPGKVFSSSQRSE